MAAPTATHHCVVIYGHSHPQANNISDAMKPHLSTSNSSMFAKRVRLSPCLLTLLAFMALVAVLSGEDFIFSFIRLSPEPDQLLSRSGRSLNRPRWSFLPLMLLVSDAGSRREKLPFAIGEREGDCDIYRGRWVRDESTRPHYQESDCPYIQPQLTCQEHGRPDKEYQFWRWQPRDCDLPRFLDGRTCIVVICKILEFFFYLF
ncbi:hypothetical protein BHE74_00056689 [Ensete ventricosum]|nr:hypothetical protein GW17_00033276 [Ensete ventricosum]RWW38105.1 hypothetical protein BHE74_00056689 [Ensete ventricosum]RZS26589.1 hypothetical protein BHM03_00059946 [Ensete ventricosum]